MRGYALLLVKIAVTGGALFWAFHKASPDAMLAAVSRLSAGTFALATALLFANTAVGALRWRGVLQAYGGKPPPLSFLARAYVVALFYNTFVPGNIGGDALRAHVTRKTVPNVADAYVAIVIERGLGLSGLLLLAAGGALFVVPGWTLWGVLFVLTAVAAAVVSVTLPQLCAWVAQRLPERHRAKIPPLAPHTNRSVLAFALLLSVVSQGLAMLSAHVLVKGLSPQVTLADSLAAVPLSMLSLYVPVSVAGLGVREAAFVVLYARAGVAAADATAASLAFMAELMVCGLIGGAVHLMAPLDLEKAENAENARRTSAPG
jgi:uncharacterized membrane protein YbhN (UPF0104 family)